MTLSISFTNHSANDSISSFPFTLTGTLSGTTNADSVSMTGITYSTPATATGLPQTSAGARTLNGAPPSNKWSFNFLGPTGITPGDAFFVIVQAVDSGSSPDRVANSLQLVFSAGVLPGAKPGKGGKKKKKPKPTSTNKPTKSKKKK